MHQITIAKLQDYIRKKDHQPTLTHEYFLKLVEEVGELSQAIRKNPPRATEATLKGSIEEEIVDVLYYTLAIANCYGIDVEKWFYLKEKLNDEKYGRNMADTLSSYAKKYGTGVPT